VTESRKVAAILVADIVGYSRLMGIDEEGTLTRLRALRADLIDPTISIHGGRLVKRTGDGAIVEFRSVVEAVRCAIEVREGFVERNASLPEAQRFQARVGIHLGDVIEEADGDLMGDGVNIAARLEGVCEPGAILLSEDAYRQVRDKINETFVDLGEQSLKNIARPMRTYALSAPAGARPAGPARPVAPNSFGWTRGRSALAPIFDSIVFPAIAGKPRSREERREAVRSTVAAILQNVTPEKGAIVDNMATGRRPAVESTGVAAVVGDKTATQVRSGIGSWWPVPGLDRRSQRRSFVRFLILVGILATLASRAFHNRESFTNSSAPPATVAEERLAQAPLLSFVVLPFANLSGDPEQDYLADGLTDDLTTDLSRLPGSFVIAHSTALAYKGRPVEARQLRKLRVRYAVEGSVRRVGETIAVNTQLISTETGAQIWADRIEGDRNRPGELQAELVSRIADALGVPPAKAGPPGQ
jgi:class 3 adenylate cyclase/TolB-like protein